MAELMQLDRAAAMAGKSEVTLRRLIKAGKIPFQKEKTLTGFVYLVDPDHIHQFYNTREGVILDAVQSSEESVDESGEAESSPRQAEPVRRSQIRVAVAGESGNAQEYWQKKSELYEEKYFQEITKHSQTREELGIWRGRAEQTQAMLMKLLPAPHDVEVHQTAAQPTPQKGEDKVSVGVVLTIALLIVLLMLAGGAALYLKLAS